MPVIGLTGGIGTGKSEVATELRSLGAIVLSADDAARTVTAKGSPALAEIAARFGEGVLLPDGSLHREALAARVFGDPAERRALEAITHPRILALLREQINDVMRNQPNAEVVVETPLLYEAGMGSWFDAVIVVAARERTQVERLERFRGLSEVEAQARIAAQMPILDKIANADYTIWNDDDRDTLGARVREAWQAIRMRCAERNASVRRGENGACANTSRML
jgi:dephospho-CoA kinase